MDDAKEYLANFIGVVYGYADPEIVILGGSVALKIDGFVEEVEALAKERVYEIMKPYVKVRKSTLNDLLEQLILHSQRQNKNSA